MKKKKYEGKLQIVLSNSIHLNINSLEKGVYILKIVNKNKVIKTTSFNKI